MLSYRLLPDDMLASVIRRLERQVASLRLSSTAVGIRLYERYRAALDAARTELERRSTP